MANYAVTTYTIRGDFAVVLAALKTKLETIDSTSNAVIESGLGIVPEGNTFRGFIIYNTWGGIWNEICK